MVDALGSESQARLPFSLDDGGLHLNLSIGGVT
jgi:hypothetical protein